MALETRYNVRGSRKAVTDMSDFMAQIDDRLEGYGRSLSDLERAIYRQVPEFEEPKNVLDITTGLPNKIVHRRNVDFDSMRDIAQNQINIESIVDADNVLRGVLRDANKDTH